MPPRSRRRSRNSGGVPSARLGVERAVALELERMRCRSPTGACMDVGHQLGQVACEAPDDDDQHHAGVVRQPLRQGADPPRHGSSADGEKGGDDPPQRRADRPPLRRSAPRHQASSPTLLARRAVRHRAARGDAPHRRRGQAARASGAARDIRATPIVGVFAERSARKHRQTPRRRDGASDGAAARCCNRPDISTACWRTMSPEACPCT